MEHVTLNSGHAVTQDPGDVDRRVIERLTADVAALTTPDGQARVRAVPGTAGRYTWSGRAWRPGCPLFTVSAADGQPVAAFAVAAGDEGAEALWSSLHAQADDAGVPVLALDAPAAPWCAALVLPAAVLNPDCLTWLGDFERCVAWTVLEVRKLT